MGVEGIEQAAALNVYPPRVVQVKREIAEKARAYWGKTVPVDVGTKPVWRREYECRRAAFRTRKGPGGAAPFGVAVGKRASRVSGRAPTMAPVNAPRRMGPAATPRAGPRFGRLAPGEWRPVAAFLRPCAHACRR